MSGTIRHSATEARKKAAPGEAGSRSQAARQALLAAALVLFAERGYAATSTRQIAAAAGVNISLISYHFGGKDGLRQACARAIVERVRGVAAPALLAADSQGNPQAAANALKAAITAMVRFLLSGEQAKPFVSFVLRELADPGAAFEILYHELFFPLHRAACQLWARATGNDPESPGTRIAVFAAIGQVVYFRIARPLIQRRMGWREVGDSEIDAILGIVLANFDAQLEAARRAR